VYLHDGLLSTPAIALLVCPSFMDFSNEKMKIYTLTMNVIFL
jgi:hypothetical protein